MLKNGQDILFSIILPSFNRAHFIQIAINSVIEQTYSSWELIIIDDGSTDNTKKVVSSFEDKRIRYYFKENEEKSVARNLGIEKANGRYISFLDDDDYYHPQFLERFLSRILDSGSQEAAFYCFENTQLEEGTIIPEKFTKEQLINPIRLLWEEETNHHQLHTI